MQMVGAFLHICQFKMNAVFPDAAHIFVTWNAHITLNWIKGSQNKTFNYSPSVLELF